MSKLEQLTIATYLDHFDCINIFTYKPILFNNWKFNSKIHIYNASDIIPESEKFYYTGNGDCPTQSVVGFSDIFRYKMLYNIGDWYSDFDVACLKPYTFTENDTVIRSHEKYTSISNICKFKKNDEVLIDLYNTTKNHVTENNAQWDTPLDIFNKTIHKYGYEKYIVKEYLGTDNFNKTINPLIAGSIIDVDLTNTYAIHWCRSAITTGNWSSCHYYDTDNPFPGTVLNYLYSKYNI